MLSSFFQTETNKKSCEGLFYLFSFITWLYLKLATLNRIPCINIVKINKYHYKLIMQNLHTFPTAFHFL